MAIIARLSNTSAKGSFKQQADSGEERTEPDQAEHKAQLHSAASHFIFGTSLVTSINHDIKITASHRRWRYPQSQDIQGRFITRKRWLGWLSTLDPLPQPSECRHYKCALPHSSEVFFNGLCSSLPQDSLHPSSRYW